MNGLFGKFLTLIDVARQIAGENGNITEANMFSYNYAVVKGVTGEGQTFTVTLDIKEGEE